MKVLVAEDERVSRRALTTALTSGGYEVIAVEDGVEALRVLRSADAPKLAILDWVMPKMDGLDVIRMIRAVPTDQPPYLIVLTSKDGHEDVLTVLENGANDYMTKSQDVRELLSRVRVGSRVVHLQAELARRVRDAEASLALIKKLQGLLPICSYCKKIRNDRNYWEEIEQYLHEHTDVDFSHGVCPTCYEQILMPQIKECKKPPQDAV